MEKTLGDLFANLSYGLLSNLAEGGSGSGTIPDAQHGRMIYLVNQGLTALYSRFILQEREFMLRVKDFKSTYLLHSDHAFTSTGPGGGSEAWIVDSSNDPFTDDIIKILFVVDEGGKEVPLNDVKTGEDQSFFTLNHNTLQVPFPVTGDFYYVVYQAKHPLILTSDPTDLTQVIKLPEILFRALEAHIAGHVFTSKNGQEHIIKGSEYLATYEKICVEAEISDTLSTSIVRTNDKLEQRGFK